MRFERLIRRVGFDKNGIGLGVFQKPRIGGVERRVAMPGVRIALPHFVFEKANGGAATEAYEHQPRVVDDEKKQPEQEVSQRYEHGYAGPPSKCGVSGRKNAGQCPEQHQNGQYLPNSPVVEKGKMHERAKIQPRTLKILCRGRLVYS